MLFISPLKVFMFSRYLRKSQDILDFLVIYKNGLIRKVNFKIDGVAT